MRAVDIDTQALLATEDNARRNAIEADRIRIEAPTKLSDEPTDVLLANILAGPLIELAPKARKTGGLAVALINFHRLLTLRAHLRA